MLYIYCTTTVSPDYHVTIMFLSHFTQGLISDSEETDFVPDSKLFEYVFVLSLKETTKGCLIACDYHMNYLSIT